MLKTTASDLTINTSIASSSLSSACMVARNMKAVAWDWRFAAVSSSAIAEKLLPPALLVRALRLLLPYPSINPKEILLMFNNAKPVTFLIAEDDPDDRLLIHEAFLESLVSNCIYFVEGGVELLDYPAHQD